MKDDAQLVCPISYVDPHQDLWSDAFAPPPLTLQIPALPLQQFDNNTKKAVADIETTVAIEELPVRCMPAGAALFKDTDHAFRWFLAPYAQLYFVSAATAHSEASGDLGAWVQQRKASSSCASSASVTAASDWLIVCVCTGQRGEATVFEELGERFFHETPGDSCLAITPPAAAPYSSAGLAMLTPPRPPAFSRDLDRLHARLSACICASFQRRRQRYTEELRRLEGQADFREYFIVHESLALMLQMARMYSACRDCYHALALATAQAPAAAFIASDWPLPTSSGSTGAASEEEAARGVLADDYILSTVKQRACELAAYSINTMRTRVLRSKASLLEARQYLCARQMFLSCACLGDRGRAALLAQQLLEEIGLAISARAVNWAHHVSGGSRLTAEIVARYWTSTGALHQWAALLELQQQQGGDLASLAQFSFEQVRLLLGELRATGYTTQTQPAPGQALSGGRNLVQLVEGEGVLWAAEHAQSSFLILSATLEERLHTPYTSNSSSSSSSQEDAVARTDASILAALAEAVATQCLADNKPRLSALFFLTAAERTATFRQEALLEAALEALSTAGHSGGATLRPWLSLCFEVLLRMLQCARQTNNSQLYARTTIRLADPAFAAHCRRHGGEAFLRDLFALIADGQLVLPAPLCMPLRHCFALASEHVAGEGAGQRVQRVVVAEESLLTVRIHSYIPVPIAVDVIGLLYRSSRRDWEGEGERGDVNSFECTAAGRLVLAPGHNLVRLAFVAAAPGVYACAEICAVLAGRSVTLLDEPQNCCLGPSANSNTAGATALPMIQAEAQ